jgi:hypothetical protein
VRRSPIISEPRQGRQKFHDGRAVAPLRLERRRAAFIPGVAAPSALCPRATFSGPSGADHADHGPLLAAGGIATDRDAPAERVLARPQALGEGAVHQDRARRALPVQRVREIAPAEERDAQRLEVARRDPLQVGFGIEPRLLGRLLGEHEIGPVPGFGAGERQVGVGAHGVDAR